MNMILHKTKLDDFDRIARLNKIMASCVDKRMNLIAEALLLGWPQFTDNPRIPTSCVTITDDGRVVYVWNRTFFDNASDLAIKYVCFHEALHIILNHIPRFKLIQDLDHEVANKAADIVVNEILDDVLPMAGIATYYDIELDPFLKPRCKSGTDGVYTRNESFETVYKLLLEKKKEDGGKGKKDPQKGQGDQDKEGAAADAAQSGDQDDEKGGGKQEPGMLDSHEGWENHLSPETQKEIETLIEEVKEQEEKINKPRGRRGRKAGNASDHLTVELKEVNKVHVVPWQKLLKNRLASVYKPNDSENWARPHRKLYQFYPDVLLPGPHESETMTSLILACLDTSGSMADESIAELVGIVESLPKDNYEVVVVWFDTELYECTDITKPQGRGGTSFRAIENVMKGEKPIWQGGGYDSDYGYSAYGPNRKKSTKEIKRYPDVVLVLTDGEASNPHPQHEDRWIFIVTKDGTDEYIKDLKSTIWRL